MACRKGTGNYKNDVLIKIVGEILPNGEYGWQVVAIEYQDATKEKSMHTTTNLKKH
jgi:hypothetical protein